MMSSPCGPADAQTDMFANCSVWLILDVDHWPTSCCCSSPTSTELMLTCERSCEGAALLYLLQLALVVLVGDHQSQGQVTFHPPGSFTE